MRGILAVHPGDSAFVSGKMLMPLEGTGVAEVTLKWSDNLLNTYLLLAFVILALLNLRNLISVIPALTDCLRRWKANVNLDASLKLAYSRNSVAAAMLLPAALLSSRYELLGLDYTEALSPAVQTLAVTGTLLVYVMVRRILFEVCTLRCRRTELALAAHHSSYNYFISAGLIISAALGICLIFRMEEDTVRTVIFAAAGIFYFIAVLRKLQIFNSFCGPIQTFLYLCALEILPTGALIAAALLL